MKMQGITLFIFIYLYIEPRQMSVLQGAVLGTN